MVRREAAQVHQQVSRLLRGNYLKKPPVWFQAVLEYPPLPLPPKAPPPRTAYDLKPVTGRPVNKLRPQAPIPEPIYYIEDDLRRQFFRDHPFEAFRPTTLIEEGRGVQGFHSLGGQAWTRLRQRGRNPTPEDAIQFAVNLYQNHGVLLSDAYAQAVDQFRALRSEHHIATQFAVFEAEWLGGQFSNTEIAHGFEKEIRNLSTFERQAEIDQGEIAARKRWRAKIDKKTGVNQWSRGEEYVQLWRSGVRPTYSPVLTQPITDASEVDVSQTADYMQMGRAKGTKGGRPSKGR